MLSWLLALSLLTAAPDPPANPVAVIGLSELEALLDQPGDTLYVINFWATWCRPCVAELPYFEAAAQRYADRPVRMVLVSLDFRENLDRVNAFVTRKGLTPEVVLLDETDYDRWVGRVDADWQGDIPATLFYHPVQKKRTFKSAELSAEELDSIIVSHL